MNKERKSYKMIALEDDNTYLIRIFGISTSDRLSPGDIIFWYDHYNGLDPISIGHIVDIVKFSKSYAIININDTPFRFKENYDKFNEYLSKDLSLQFVSIASDDEPLKEVLCVVPVYKDAIEDDYVCIAIKEMQSKIQELKSCMDNIGTDLSELIEYIDGRRNND